MEEKISKKSNKIFLTVGLIIIVVLLGFYFWQIKPKTFTVSQEVIEKLETINVEVSKEQDEFLSLLARSTVSGGPPKDGIPSIDKPKYTSVLEADRWLEHNDIVFGVHYHGFVAAYPQRILVWHEIVNEKINGNEISITYCPLTGTAIGFEGEYANGISSQFGVSGTLVNSNLIMYDRQSDSYWPQILGKAISGPAKGISLSEFPVVWTTWEKWKNKYPDTLVLSQSTGFFRNYGKGGDPYGSYLEENKGYYSSGNLLFSPIHEDGRLHPKAVVVGMRDSEGNAAAVVKDVLRNEKSIEFMLGGKTVVVHYDQELDFYRAIVKESGEWINAFDAMWFAWAAFYPKTELLK